MALLHRSRRTDSTPPATRVSPAADGARAARPGEQAAGRTRPVRSAPTPRPGRVHAVRTPPAPGPGAAELVTAGRPAPAVGPRERALPPSVARVAARTRLSAELLAAILEVEERTRATLDDIERADALADRLLVRRRNRLAAAAPGGPAPLPGGTERLSA